MATHIVIPARFSSTRLPGKALVDIAGKPMIQHVYERALKAGLSSVIVATDDDRIMDAVERFNGQAILTKASHQSGTERIAEVIEELQFKDDDIVINLQGDEPLIPPTIIVEVAKDLTKQTDAQVATLCEPLKNAADVFNPNITKVVMDEQGFALYFSHAALPWYRDGFSQNAKTMPADFIFYRHIGIYAYRAAFVKKYVNWAPSPLEQVEKLEQLRVLWYGQKIHVATASEHPGPGVDTPEDLALVRTHFEKLTTRQ